MIRALFHPYTFIVALLLLGVVAGVSCWPRVERVPATPTPARPTPTVYVFSPTPTPRDIFTIPPTPATGGH